MRNIIEEQLAKFPFEQIIRTPIDCIGNEPYGFIPRALLNSLTFQALTVTAIRVLLAILREHVNSGECQNGRLSVTYIQFERAGCSRNLIKEGICELEHYGIIRRDGVSSGGNGKTASNLFRLTWIGDWQRNRPTNEWRGVNDEKVVQWRQRMQQRRSNSEAARRLTSTPTHISASVIQLNQRKQLLKSTVHDEFAHSQINEREISDAVFQLSRKGRKI